MTQVPAKRIPMKRTSPTVWSSTAAPTAKKASTSDEPRDSNRAYAGAHRARSVATSVAKNQYDGVLGRVGRRPGCDQREQHDHDGQRRAAPQ